MTVKCPFQHSLSDLFFAKVLLIEGECSSSCLLSTSITSSGYGQEYPTFLDEGWLDPAGIGPAAIASLFESSA